MRTDGVQVFLILLIAPTGAEDIVDEETPTTERLKSQDFCYSKKEDCCSSIYLDVESDLRKCLSLHQSALPTDNAPIHKFRYFTVVVECLYKNRKYIGKGDTVNMKVVKSTALKLFPGRPKESAYYVEMFEFCRQDAKTTLDLMQQSPSGRMLLKESTRPYFVLVFFCNAFYHKYHDCPYFRWEGRQGTKFLQECQRDREKCHVKEILAMSRK